MPKSAAQSAEAFQNADNVENVEFPAFDASKATDQFRVFAERGAEQSKEVYDRMKTGAEWAQKAVESAADTARAVSAEMSLKTIAAMRSNADATFSHLEALVGAKTLSEVIELQAGFVRARFDAALSQGRDMQSAAAKAAEDMSRPVKDGLETAMKELKVA